MLTVFLFIELAFNMRDDGKAIFTFKQEMKMLLVRAHTEQDTQDMLRQLKAAIR